MSLEVVLRTPSSCLMHHMYCLWTDFTSPLSQDSQPYNSQGRLEYFTLNYKRDIIILVNKRHKLKSVAHFVMCMSAVNGLPRYTYCWHAPTSRPSTSSGCLSSSLPFITKNLVSFKITSTPCEVQKSLIILTLLNMAALDVDSSTVSSIRTNTCSQARNPSALQFCLIRVIKVINKNKEQ